MSYQDLVILYAEKQLQREKELEKREKTAIHNPKIQSWLIFASTWHALLFNNFTELKQALEIKKTLLWQKNQNAKDFKIKFQQRGFKIKCSIDTWTILYQFFATFSNNISLLEFVFDLSAITSLNKITLINLFNKVSRFNNSSPMNNTVAKNIKHLPQLFALDT